MRNLLSVADKTAMSLSFLCVIHCLAMPLAVVFLPMLAGLPFADEAFHMWMVFAVIPISAYALTMGCKKHKRYQSLIIGAAGLAILVVAVLLGHDFLGEFWEKTLTVIGACVIAFSHLKNYRMCQHKDGCGTAEQ